MARAGITRVEATPEGDNVRFNWTTIFYGTDVPGGVDFDNAPTFLRTPAMTSAQCKTAIRNAIAARAAELGRTLQGTPQHVDELFHGL